ncbi:MAG: TauD/TfdA family dioxygenase [Rhodospirillales bacterium]
MSTAGTNSPDSIQATPLTPVLAAEITGADLSQPLSDDAFAKIYRYFLDHEVLVFRGQDISAKQFVDFSRRFGPLAIHHFNDPANTIEGLPEIRILSNVKKNGKLIGSYRSGEYWHFDLSFYEKTSHATVLYGLECPPEGADTMFASATRAYESLSDDMKEKVSAMTGIFARNTTYAERYPERPPLTEEQLNEVPPVEHPLVNTHPETGKRCLHLSWSYTAGIVSMERAEARMFVTELEQYITQPQFVYSHKWQPKDLIVWDNRSLLHRATPYDPKYRRVIYRAQVLGDKPYLAPVS